MTSMLCPKCFETDEWSYYDENLGRLKLKPNAPEDIKQSYLEFHKEYAEANEEDLSVNFDAFSDEQKELLKNINSNYESLNVIELEDILSDELQLNGLCDDPNEPVNDYGKQIEQLIDIVVEME